MLETSDVSETSKMRDKFFFCEGGGADLKKKTKTFYLFYTQQARALANTRKTHTRKALTPCALSTFCAREQKHTERRNGVSLVLFAFGGPQNPTRCSSRTRR